MTQTIALAGKGGVGKTTITGMLIQYLCAKKNGAVLAVDADANSNLNEVLGVEVESTLGDIREEMARAEMSAVNPIPAGMTKQDYAEMKFGDALVEGDDYDLLVMGRTQGKGCYCFVNGILSTQVARYAANYRYVVVDNEAGMEHISRGILPAIDTVILVSDASRRGIQAAGRIFELTKELKLGAKETKLLVNRAPGGVLSDGVREEIDKFGMELLGVLPQDDGIYAFDGEGRPTSELPADNAFRKALYEALDKMNF
jgi:CO dehydrogenase maturation factor